MSLGEKLVEAKRKGQKVVLGTFVLFGLEYWVLGDAGIIAMFFTFLVMFWHINRLLEPFLEMTGDAMESALKSDDKESA